MKENETIEGTIVEEKRFSKKQLIGGGIAAVVIAAIGGIALFVLNGPKTGAIEIETDENES